MVRIEKLELTNSVARYKCYPENSEGSGIVTLNRNTRERFLEESVAGYENTYVAYILRQIEKY